MGNWTQSCVAQRMPQHEGKTVASVEVFHDEYTDAEDRTTDRTYHGVRITFTDGCTLDLIEAGQTGQINIQGQNT